MSLRRLFRHWFHMAASQHCLSRIGLPGLLQAGLAASCSIRDVSKQQHLRSTIVCMKKGKDLGMQHQEFRYAVTGISVLNGGCLFDRQQRGWTARTRNGQPTICLESPVEPGA